MNLSAFIFPSTVMKRSSPRGLIAETRLSPKRWPVAGTTGVSPRAPTWSPRDSPIESRLVGEHDHRTLLLGACGDLRILLLAPVVDQRRVLFLRAVQRALRREANFIKRPTETSLRLTLKLRLISSRMIASVHSANSNLNCSGFFSYVWYPAPAAGSPSFRGPPGIGFAAEHRRRHSGTPQAIVDRAPDPQPPATASGLSPFSTRFTARMRISSNVS